MFSSENMNPNPDLLHQAIAAVGFVDHLLEGTVVWKQFIQSICFQYVWSLSLNAVLLFLSCTQWTMHA